MRIAKYLAHNGIASRRQCEELVSNGKIKVNGEIVTALGTQIDPHVDKVELDGKIIKEKQSMVYLLLNKPPGYICSASDPQGRPTVLELIKDVPDRIYPVGRLDYNTSGLLILSNDGEFTNLMIHPRYKIEKTYEAWVKGKVKDNELEPMRRGLLLEDGLTAPARVRLLTSSGDKSLLEIVIHEGKKRQIKRMCTAVGHPVIGLRRTRLGILSIDGLAEGNYRFLQTKEIEQLKKSAGSNAAKNHY